MSSVPPHVLDKIGHSLSLVDAILLRVSMLAVRKNQSAGPKVTAGTLGPADTPQARRLFS